MVAIFNNRVLVLACEAKASVSIIESCADMGMAVYGGSEKKHGCGLGSKYVQEKMIYPSPKTQPQQCIETIEEYVKQNQIAVLFPVGDVMTDLISKNQDRLRQHTRFVLPSYSIFIQGRNKVMTLKAAQRAGCPIPCTWYPEDVGLEAAVQDIDAFPVLIKPAISAGARGITFCSSKQEIHSRFPEIQEKYGSSFLQEFVPQQGIQYKVDAVMDAEQNLLAGADVNVVYGSYEKLREHCGWEPGIPLRESVNHIFEGIDLGY